MLAPLHNRTTPLKPLKWYKNLANTKGRLEARAFLIEGDRGIRQIMSLHPDEIMEIITIDKPPAHYHNYSVRFVTEQQFHSISSTKTPQGIMALVRLPKDIHSEHLPKNIGTKILLLEDIQDPGNVGAVIRTAAAFGVSRFVSLKEAAHPFHHRSVRVAGSALFRIPIFEGPSICELTQLRVPLLTLSPGGKWVDESQFPPRFGLLPGLEGPGLPEHLKHRTHITIPMEQGIESLNAAMATGIALYLWRRQTKELPKLGARK